MRVPGLTGVVAVAAGEYHSLAVKSDGSVWAWGDNYYGQLGDGTTTNRSAPTSVPGLTGVVAMAAGYGHTIALRSDGSVWAWGDNSFGHLGDGTTTSRSSPVRVPDLTGVTYVAVGDTYTMAIKADGTILSWGDSTYGQLGDGTFANRSVPGYIVNESVTGILDLNAAAPNNVPASAIPKVIMAARKTGALVSLTLGANMYFGSIDLGALAAGSFSASSTFKVYVAAIAPNGGIYLLDTNRNLSLYNGGPLREYVNNVTLGPTLHYFVSILDGMNLSELIGARILVGYGTDDQEMLAAQRYREIYVAQPDPRQ
ncbi:MAG: hypothetical protein HW416_3979 [Chloroflexi bacterium]|nr:hypothetical protein [Chloroflexota bacterium]